MQAEIWLISRRNAEADLLQRMESGKVASLVLLEFEKDIWGAVSEKCITLEKEYATRDIYSSSLWKEPDIHLASLHRPWFTCPQLWSMLAAFRGRCGCG